MCQTTDTITVAADVHLTTPSLNLKLLKLCEGERPSHEAPVSDMASTGISAEQLLAQHNARLAGRFITPMTKKQKIASFRASFAFFDIDNSGTMSAQEFLQVLTRQHGTAAGLTLADAQEILADFDEDGSGSLDVEEFIQAMISMDPELAEELEEGESIVFKSAAKLSTAAALGGGQGTTEYA